MQRRHHRRVGGSGTRPETARHVVDQIKGRALEFAATNELNDSFLVLPVAALVVVKTVARVSGDEQFSGDTRSGGARDSCLYSAASHLPLKSPQDLFCAACTLLGDGQERVGDVEDVHVPFASGL